jgi:hypothetical protein
MAEVSGQFDEISRQVAALAEEKSNLMARLKMCRPRGCEPADGMERDENQSPSSGARDSGNQYMLSQNHGCNLDMMKGPKKDEKYSREKGGHIPSQNFDASQVCEPESKSSARFAKIFSELSVLNHIRNAKAGASAPNPCAGAEVVGLEAPLVKIEQYRPSSSTAQISKEISKSVRFSEVSQAAMLPPNFLLDEQLVSAQIMHSSQADTFSARNVSTRHADEEPNVSAKFEVLIQAKDLEISSLLNERRKADERAAVLLSELGQSSRTVLETKKQLAEARECLEQLNTSRLEDTEIMRELELVHVRQNTIISEYSKKEEGYEILIRQLRSDLENARGDLQKLAEQVHQATALDNMLGAECERLEGVLRTSEDQSMQTINELRQEIRKLTSEVESEKLQNRVLRNSLLREKEEKLIQDARCDTEKQDWLRALESMKSESAVTASLNQKLKASLETLNSNFHELKQSLDIQQAEHAMDKESWAMTQDSLRTSLDRLRMERHSMQLLHAQLIRTLSDLKELHFHSVSSLQTQVGNSQTALDFVRIVTANSFKIMQDRYQSLDEQYFLVSKTVDEQRFSLMSSTAKQIACDTLVDSLQQSLASYTQENSSLRENHDKELRTWQVRAESLEASLEAVRKRIKDECKLRKDQTAELDQAGKKLDHQQELLILETTKHISEMESVRKKFGILLGQKSKVSLVAQHAKIITTDLISSLAELQEQYNAFNKDQEATVLSNEMVIKTLRNERDFFICECNSLKGLIAEEQLRYEQERGKILAGKNEIQCELESLRTVSNQHLMQYEALHDTLCASNNLVVELRLRNEAQTVKFKSERESLIHMKDCGESTVKELTTLNTGLTSSIENLKTILADAHSHNRNLQSEAATTEIALLRKVNELQQALDSEVNERMCMKEELNAERARRVILSTTETKILEVLKAKDHEVQTFLSKLLAMELKLKSTEMDLENACQAVYHSLKHEETIGAALSSVIECWNTYPIEGLEVLNPPEIFGEHGLKKKTELPAKPESLMLISYLREIILKFLASYKDLKSHQVNQPGFTKESMQYLNDDKIKLGLGEARKQIEIKNHETVKDLQDKVVILLEDFVSAKFLQQQLVQQLIIINQDMDCIVYDMSMCQYKTTHVLHLGSEVQQARVLEQQKIDFDESSFDSTNLKREAISFNHDPAVLNTTARVPTLPRDEDILSFFTMIQQCVICTEQLHDIGFKLQQELEFSLYKTEFTSGCLKLENGLIDSERNDPCPEHTMFESRRLEALIQHEGIVLHHGGLEAATTDSRDLVSDMKIVGSFQVGDQNLDENTVQCVHGHSSMTIGSNRRSDSSEVMSHEYIRKEIFPKFAILTYERNTAYDKAQEMANTIAVLEKDICLLKKSSKDKSKLLQELRDFKRRNETLQIEVQKFERVELERDKSQQEVQSLSEKLHEQAEEIELFRQASSEQAKTANEFRDLKEKFELLNEEKLYIETVAGNSGERQNSQQQSKTLEEKVKELYHEVSRLSIAVADKKTMLCELRYIREQFVDLKKENHCLHEVAAKRLNFVNNVLSIAYQVKELRTDVTVFAEVFTEMEEQQNHFSTLKLSYSQSLKQNEALAKSSICFADQLAVNTRNYEELLLKYCQIEQQLKLLNDVCFERDQALSKLSVMRETVCNLQKDIETNLQERELSYQDVKQLAMELYGLRSRFLELEKAAVANGHQFTSKESGCQQESKENEMSFGNQLFQKCTTKIRFLNPVCFQLPCNDSTLSLADEAKTAKLQAENKNLLLRIYEFEQKEVQLQALVAEERRKALEIENDLRENTVELFDRNSEIESLKSRISMMEQRLKRKDNEIESAIQRKENQIVQFLRAVEAKTARKDSDLEETRARLLRAEAALEKLTRQLYKTRQKGSSTGSSFSILSESDSS